MLAAVVEHFLDRVTERDFDAPFIALLRKLGFTDIHYLHGQYEFGKDFIGHKTEGGQVFQFVFQSKAGDLKLGDWARELHNSIYCAQTPWRIRGLTQPCPAEASW